MIGQSVTVTASPDRQQQPETDHGESPRETHDVRSEVASDLRAPTCGQVTASNIEGPFFTPFSPARSNLRPPGTQGEILRVLGRVLDTNCMPIPGALLDFWQADAAGDYDLSGPKFRGHQFADNDGRYLLETIVPGRYRNGATFRPAHLHVKVRGNTFAVLTTQLYFPNDPFNATDGFIVPSLIMSVRDAPAGGKEGLFDFVLRT